MKRDEKVTAALQRRCDRDFQNTPQDAWDDIFPPAAGGEKDPGIPELLEAGCFDSIEEISELRRSACYDDLIHAYDVLRTERLSESCIHGRGHVERVMLLGAIIAMQQGFSAGERDLLLFACSYHDIGRINDARDEQHGKRSADALAALPLPGISSEELRCIQAAVAAHSTKDSMIDSFAVEYGVPVGYLDLCRLLCKGLKDADNLDRVRIHDLDIRHLRFDKSKALKKTAESIYRLSRQ